MTLPLYMSMAGPISLITWAMTLTGRAPSSFQALEEMLYLSERYGAKHCAVTMVSSGSNTHVSSLDLMALLAAGDQELVTGSKIEQRGVVSAPIIRSPLGKIQQAASPT